MVKTIRYCDRCHRDMERIGSGLIEINKHEVVKILRKGIEKDSVYEYELCWACSVELNKLMFKFMREKQEEQESAEKEEKP